MNAPVSGGQVLIFLAIAVISIVVVRSLSRGKHRWPQIACESCDGAGWEMARTLVGLRTRKVRRPCPTCGGSPWSER